MWPWASQVTCLGPNKSNQMEKLSKKQGLHWKTDATAELNIFLFLVNKLGAQGEERVENCFEYSRATPS